jgi:ubiquitin-conjugating enzyme E2 variant
VALPKWAVPPKTPDEPFATKPFSASEISIHTLGGVINAACSLGLLVLIGIHADVFRRDWPFALIAIMIGVYLGDLISGVLHWAFDTWFDENNASVRRMVILVREHHIYPNRIFTYSLWHEVGILSWFALLSSGPLFAWLALSTTSPGHWRYAVGLSGLTVSTTVVFMLQFHKCGHRTHSGPLVRLLQRMHLLLSPAHHLRHHAREHASHYCLINGWADLTLGKLGFFRWLESLVSNTTGAIPRADDREWRRRYGRWVEPDPNG